MSAPRTDSISMPARRVFGATGTHPDEESGVPLVSEDTTSPLRRLLGRLSFSQTQHRPSFSSRRNDGESTETPTQELPNPMERPSIPNALQPSNETYTTPLPILSMIVLSITMLGEFLSANVSTPFLLFMVKGFGEASDDADVAFWTGILVSAFFMTQFLTSLLWATVAEKHGRRTVLFVSLLGSAITCLVFGTSTNLEQAIVVRLLQGIFAGAVGVARGSVIFITDGSNEGRAYAIMGFCWGFGGVAGAIIGGSFERPAVKWPGLFAHIPIFVKFPYLLPCAIASSITFTGSMLSCFLNRDGGPREGAIRLLPEKEDSHPPPIAEEEFTLPSPIEEEEEEEPRGIVGELKNKVSRKFSGIFATRVPDAHSSSPFASPPLPMSSSNTRLDRTRTFSRTSRANGSAYGYGGFRSRLASGAAAVRRNSATSSARRRRGSNLDGPQHSAPEGNELNFAQRLLMANENAVTNIADLWVAAAINVDNEDPFESDTEASSDIESLESTGSQVEDNTLEEGGSPEAPAARDRRGSKASNSTARRLLQRRQSNTAPVTRFGSPRRPSTSNQGQSITPRHNSFAQSLEGSHTPMRRFSTTTPAIFAHSGVRTPMAVLDAQQLLTRTDTLTEGGALTPIMESRRPTEIDVDVIEKPPSVTSQLPFMVIFQYGVLALHTTTHDQVFMSYLVSDYYAGGLNLNAGHFAQLIALMCLASIFYQFYLYPNVGPPRGRFSHLSMFRIGSALYIPAYLTVVLYRPFASADDDGNLLVMSALAVTTAVRYCAMTFTYTSIAILLNYMTPPSAVGYANGIAQSIVSLARCFGPVMGGYLWAVSVQNNPSGYYIGFVVCGGACALAVVSSFLIR